ncbi:MAG: type I restriction enzyme HsdR N-terminal domain-containing protein [Bacteroidales bacterium]|nr:type I restriction enzyme HsdR N-terminal domain-containing protein [Bacteroidales bacterium]
MMIWDPLRKKAVTSTPEEIVRQWFIRMLSHVAGVPETLMMSEVPMKYGGKGWRADIVVYGRDAQPLAIVECKRPGVALDAEVAGQALRYSAVLSVRCIILTNREKTYAYLREGDSFKETDHLPSYEEMTTWQQ